MTIETLEALRVTIIVVLTFGIIATLFHIHTLFLQAQLEADQRKRIIDRKDPDQDVWDFLDGKLE